MCITVKICAVLVVLLLPVTQSGVAHAGNVKNVQNINDVNKPLSEPSVLTRTVDEFHTFIRSILDYFLSSPISDETFQLLRKSVARVSRSLEAFGAKMLDATEEVTKDILDSIKKKLSSLEEEFQDLSRLTDERFERIILYVNNTVLEHTVNMDSWAENLKQQLRSINDTALYQKVCPAIDQLIKETVDELSGCCNIVIKPVRSICRSIKVVLRETCHVVADVVETIESCIFSEEKFDDMVLQCLEDIFNDVSSLMDRVASLRHALMTKLPTTILLSNFCVSMVSVTMATRRTSVEQQIEYFNKIDKE